MTALYIGGAYQGKAKLAQQIHGASASYVFNLHLLVRQTMQNQKDPMELLSGLNDCIVTCDEVGNGIIPLDRSEREWREGVGRLCCALAAQADLVVRVSAGLPQVLKGKLPEGNG